MLPVSPMQVAPAQAPRWLRLFRPAPAQPSLLTDTGDIAAGYHYWQRRVLIATIIGYATFYFVRKNLSVAMPVMEKDLGISKVDLGLFLTLHGVLYGVSKFANGFLGDQCNARAFMVVGLVASAILNVFFGLSSAVLILGFVWMLNGLVQGMGFPPCARLMTHWFPPDKLATKFSLWNISHQVGGGLIVILCSYLVMVHWRLCFLVPAGIAVACGTWLWFILPDTPPSVGLPELSGAQGTLSLPRSQSDFKAFLREQVFGNKYIWLISLANFFIYILRYSVFDWGPTLLTEAKHIPLTNAAWMVAGFEIFGLVGAIAGGWLTDRFFGGRAMRTGVFYVALATASLGLLWRYTGTSKLINTMLLCSAGFFIYGPQCLIGIAAANLATRRAAATAVGLTGFFGYGSTVLSGWGLGFLVQHHGWDAGFAGMLIVAVIATVVFALAWPAKAHGYVVKPEGTDTAKGL